MRLQLIKLYKLSMQRKANTRKEKANGRIKISRIMVKVQARIKRTTPEKIIQKLASAITKARRRKLTRNRFNDTIVNGGAIMQHIVE